MSVEINPSSEATNSPEPAGLKRSISLTFIIFYGLGTMVGGGIYALVGKVSGISGMLAPFALLMAGIVAMISAFSFSELSARLPYSAGEAVYTQAAFNRKWLSGLVGWMVIATGVVSAATLSVATIGFLQDFVAVPELFAIAALVLVMGAIAAWGVGESVMLVAIITVIEVGALLFIIAISGNSLADLPARWPELIPSWSLADFQMIFFAGFIAFYAFIGFEDMVNMAEEVKDVRRNMPIAIITCMVVTTLIYMLVTLVAILKVPPEQLATANTPFALVVKEHGWVSTVGIGFVSIFTGINGALVQIIMASRVAYGLGKTGQAPPLFSFVHPERQTPLYATALMTAIVLVLALFFPLLTLAKATSTIILIIFALINLALWRIKGMENPPGGDMNLVPRWLPMLGFIFCTVVVVTHLLHLTPLAGH